ncbi:hypothetical protein QA789_11090 [Streptomyces sp. B21-088]|uniref:hypothetical protein n=1 Tax=Streptomyces sp. B21-088 TaxID=3039411 RepID=UPI002FEEC133
MEVIDAHLDGFAAQMGGLLASAQPEGFFAARGPLAALAACGWAAHRVRRLLEDVCGRPDGDVPGLAEGGLVVAQGAG